MKAGKHGAGHRERILRAASTLFRRRGYRDSSLEAILALAGVRTVSNFYYHFPSKEALAIEVIDHWAAEYDAEVFRPSVGNPALGALERLQGLFDRMERRLRSHRHRQGCPLGNLAAEVSDRHPRLRARVADTFRRWERDIRACWRAGIDAGEIASWVEPDVAAVCTVTALEGACAMSRVYHSSDPLRFMRQVQAWALRATENPGRPLHPHDGGARRASAPAHGRGTAGSTAHARG
jgi:TetR/AcrR family transcriptional repressor of nem operon